MDFRRFGLFLVCVASLPFAFAAYQRYAKWEMRWLEADAIGAQIRGDIGPLLEYRAKARQMDADARVSAIAGGIALVLGIGLLISSGQKVRSPNSHSDSEA